MPWPHTTETPNKPDAPGPCERCGGSGAELFLANVSPILPGRRWWSVHGNEGVCIRNLQDRVRELERAISAHRDAFLEHPLHDNALADIELWDLSLIHI